MKGGCESQMAGNDLVNSLKGMLGDNADEKINAVMNMLKSDNNSVKNTVSQIENDITLSDNSDNSDTADNDKNKKMPSFSSEGKNPASLSDEGLEFLGKIKNIIDEMGFANDPRSNLLMSLRPYMRETRQKSIDNAVKILNLSRFSGLFNI